MLIVNNCHLDCALENVLEKCLVWIKNQALNISLSLINFNCWQGEADFLSSCLREGDEMHLTNNKMIDWTEECFLALIALFEGVDLVFFITRIQYLESSLIIHILFNSCFNGNEVQFGKFRKSTKLLVRVSQSEGNHECLFRFSSKRYVSKLSLLLYVRNFEFALFFDTLNHPLIHYILYINNRNLSIFHSNSWDSQTYYS